MKREKQEALSKKGQLVIKEKKVTKLQINLYEGSEKFISIKLYDEKMNVTVFYVDIEHKKLFKELFK